MRAFVIWLSLLVLAGCGLWELQASDPIVPPPVVGLLLLLIGLIAGLSMATDSAMRYVKDLTRLNRYLADQNNDLAEMNLRLLKKESTEKESRSA